MAVLATACQVTLECGRLHTPAASWLAHSRQYFPVQQPNRTRLNSCATSSRHTLHCSAPWPSPLAESVPPPAVPRNTQCHDGLPSTLPGGSGNGALIWKIPPFHRTAAWLHVHRSVSMRWLEKGAVRGATDAGRVVKHLVWYLQHLCEHWPGLLLVHHVLRPLAVNDG